MNTGELQRRLYTWQMTRNRRDLREGTLGKIEWELTKAALNFAYDEAPELREIVALANAIALYGEILTDTDDEDEITKGFEAWVKVFDSLSPAANELLHYWRKDDA